MELIVRSELNLSSKQVHKRIFFSSVYYIGKNFAELVSVHVRIKAIVGLVRQNESLNNVLFQQKKKAEWSH